MVNFKKLREKIKTYASRENTISILEQCGIEVNSFNFKFLIRDERTPSASINKDGSAYDYGSGDFYGNIISLLFDGYNMFNSVGDTTLFIAATLGIEVEQKAEIKKDFDSSKYKLSEEAKNDTRPYKEWKEKTPAQVKSYMDYLDSKFNPHDPIYKAEVSSIAPQYVFSEADENSLNEFKRVTTYDFKNSTLVVKIFDYKNEVFSYKRRRYEGDKWRTAGGTKPNKQCYIRILDNVRPIYVIEGHHDLLTAILLGINFIAIPTSNYKTWEEEELEALYNRDIIFLPDIEVKNRVGIEAMLKLKKNCESIVNSSEMVNLKEFLESLGKKVDDKMDLSDSLIHFASKSDFFTNLDKYIETTKKAKISKLQQIRDIFEQLKDKAKKREDKEKKEAQKVNARIEIFENLDKIEKLSDSQLEIIEEDDFEHFFDYLQKIRNEVFTAKALKRVGKDSAIGVTELRRIYKVYKRSAKRTKLESKNFEELQAHKRYILEMAQEGSYPLPSDMVYPTGYRSDAINLQKITFTKDGDENLIELFPLCYISELIYTTDKDNFIVEIKFPTIKRSVKLDNKTLVDNKELEMRLNAHDILIGDYLKEFKKYIYSFMRTNKDLINTKTLYSTTGWYEIEGEPKYLNPVIDDTKYYLPAIEEALTQKGEADKQREMIQRALNNRGGAISILGALGGTLVKPLELDNFFVNFYGENGAGKTLSSSIGLSLFGSPKKLKRNMNNTHTAKELILHSFKDTPLLFDEVETAGENITKQAGHVVNFIYNYTSGEGRGRGNKSVELDKVRDSSGMVFITMEKDLRTFESVTRENVRRGMYRRVIEVEANNLLSDFPYFGEMISRHYGHFGKDFINYIEKNLDEVADIYYKNICFFSDLNLRGLERAFTALFTVMKILEEKFNFNIDIAKKHLWRVAKENQDISEDVNSDERVINHFQYEIFSNINSFGQNKEIEVSNEASYAKGTATIFKYEAPKAQNWGDINYETNQIIIIPSKFDEIAHKIGTTANQLKKKLAEAEILKTLDEAGRLRYTVKATLKSVGRGRFYVIDMNKLDEFYADKKIVFDGKEIGATVDEATSELNKQLKELDSSEKIQDLIELNNKIDVFNDTDKDYVIVDVKRKEIDIDLVTTKEVSVEIKVEKMKIKDE